MPTDEPIDFESYLYDEDAPPPHNHSVDPVPKVLPRSNLSDEALLFLRGPVSTVLMPSLYTLVCLVSLPLNAVALVTFARQVRPIKPAVVFMMNLACADLLFALLLPFKIHYHFSGNDWAFGEALCRLVTAATDCNMHCSVLLIACISVDRLLAVVYPIRSLAWRRPRYAAGACVAAWALALAASAPLAVLPQTMRLGSPDVTTCHNVQRWTWQRWGYPAYFVAVAGVLFLLPALVTLACYVSVVRTLRRLPDKAGRNSRRKARAALMALTVLVLFLVCFAPTNCLLLLHYVQFSSAGASDAHLGASDGSYAAYLVFLCVGSLNCCLDPLVYYFGSSQCQRQLSAALGCRKGLQGGKKRNIYSSSDSASRSSCRSMLKSSQTTSDSMKAEPPASNTPDSFRSSLDSQYKKLLV